MSRMTTARIPDEIYEQGFLRLSESGFSVSDLVRAAFEYVADTGELPQAKNKHQDTHRTLTEAQKRDLKEKLCASQLRIELPDSWNYKDELAEGKWGDYEALA